MTKALLLRQYRTDPPPAVDLLDSKVLRYDGSRRPPMTDGPFVETSDLIAGWAAYAESWDRAP